MGRPTKILPSPELMGVVASRKLREPVIGSEKDLLSKLKLKPCHWEKLSIRQKLTAANITLNRLTPTHSLTLKLSHSLVAKLNDAETSRAAFAYIRDQMNRSFKTAGEKNPLYWYVLENLNKHASCPNPFNAVMSSSPNVEPHIHAGFGIRSPDVDIDELALLLRKNIGGGRHKAVHMVRQGTKRADQTIEPQTVRGLVGSPRYACKNLAMGTLDQFSRPFVLSRALQQASLQTLAWLSD